MPQHISAQHSARLASSNRVAHILWFALMTSVAIYGGVAFMIASQENDAASTLALPPFVFPMVAFMQASAGIGLYRYLTSPDRIRALQSQPSAELRLDGVLGLVFTASIVRWALFESVAIIGLVLAISNRSFEQFVPYGVAALALQAMTPPRVKQLALSAISP